MDYVMDEIAFKAQVHGRAYQDVMDHYGPNNDLSTLEDVYEYVKCWSKIMYRLSRSPRAMPEQVTIGQRWGAQYKEMAFLLRDALRKAA